MKELFQFIGMIAVIPVFAIYGGFVTQTLWEWFVVSTFALPKLKLAQAIGITMTASWLTNKGQQTKDTRTMDEKMSDIATSLITPMIVLLVAWIVKQAL